MRFDVFFIPMKLLQVSDNISNMVLLTVFNVQYLEAFVYEMVV